MILQVSLYGRLHRLMALINFSSVCNFDQTPAFFFCLRLNRQKITERSRDIRSNLMFEKET